jgi:hypothetical protein
MPSCRLAIERRFPSTVGGSTWGMSYPRYEVYVDIQSHPMFPDGSPGYQERNGKHHGEGCSGGAHGPVLTAPAKHRGHAHLAIHNLGLLDPKWTTRMDEACNII